MPNPCGDIALDAPLFSQPAVGGLHREDKCCHRFHRRGMRNRQPRRGVLNRWQRIRRTGIVGRIPKRPEPKRRLAAVAQQVRCGVPQQRHPVAVTPIDGGVEKNDPSGVASQEPVQ